MAFATSASSAICSSRPGAWASGVSSRRIRRRRGFVRGVCSRLRLRGCFRATGISSVYYLYVYEIYVVCNNSSSVWPPATPGLGELMSLRWYTPCGCRRSRTLCSLLRRTTGAVVESHGRPMRTLPLLEWSVQISLRVVGELAERYTITSWYSRVRCSKRRSRRRRRRRRERVGYRRLPVANAIFAALRADDSVDGAIYVILGRRRWHVLVR